MKFLADENVPPAIVNRLRGAGLNVEAVVETSAGATDTEILSRDDISNLVLITFDSDFGDLIFNHGHSKPLSIIYIRLNRAAPRHAADRVLALIEAGLPFGQMIVITRENERLRAFPEE